MARSLGSCGDRPACVVLPQAGRRMPCACRHRHPVGRSRGSGDIMCCKRPETSVGWRARCVVTPTPVATRSDCPSHVEQPVPHLRASTARLHMARVEGSRRLSTLLAGAVMSCPADRGGSGQRPRSAASSVTVCLGVWPLIAVAPLSTARSEGQSRHRASPRWCTGRPTAGHRCAGRVRGRDWPPAILAVMHTRVSRRRL